MHRYLSSECLFKKLDERPEENIMNRKPVTSSNVLSIGYAPELQILEVEFKSGEIYQYMGVSVNMYNSLMNASSIGGYLDKFIKKGGFTYIKL
jgi:hypothetical protein